MSNVNRNERLDYCDSCGEKRTIGYNPVEASGKQKCKTLLMATYQVTDQTGWLERSQTRQAEWGQYFTPPGIARFMVELFALDGDKIRLLDAGAGAGGLSAAFLDRMLDAGDTTQPVELTAHEIDPALLRQLTSEIDGRCRRLNGRCEIIPGDFIEAAVNQLQFEPGRRYSHAILNPPYKKITTDSRARRLLRQVGIETVNYYTGFVALAVALLEPQGQLVAITPRSFCNGPYYRAFRDYLLTHCSIRQLHLFTARDKAFDGDGVLQENVILHLVKGAAQEDVIISTATDGTFADYNRAKLPFSVIVHGDDPERFIHIPTTGRGLRLKELTAYRHSLRDVGIQVATGPIVDFRVREHLLDELEAGSAPLFYPGHFRNSRVEWPRDDLGKANAVAVNAHTERQLYPNDYYVVVRRFSSKEERRRIVAGLVVPKERFGPYLGFENHLNVFHQNRTGLTEMVARGLTLYLNSTQFDHDFRLFSGHTQVNATDLRNMTYPSRAILEELGHRSFNEELTQSDIDQLIDEYEHNN